MLSASLLCPAHDAHLAQSLSCAHFLCHCWRLLIFVESGCNLPCKHGCFCPICPLLKSQFYPVRPNLNGYVCCIESGCCVFSLNTMWKLMRHQQEFCVKSKAEKRVMKKSLISSSFFLMINKQALILITNRHICSSWKIINVKWAIFLLHLLKLLLILLLQLLLFCFNPLQYESIPSEGWSSEYSCHLFAASK